MLQAPLSQANWEALWAPYDQPTYDLVLAQLEATDIVLDIGAGDLRLARRMARLVKHVYAVEINPALITSSNPTLPPNLTLLVGDALKISFPPHLTCGVLLMRHCTHFGIYADKLKQAGANKLLTNARWRMGVETVNLTVERPIFDQFPFGWYACLCGATGFKPGPAHLINENTLRVTHEILECPNCNQKRFLNLERPSGKDITL